MTRKNIILTLWLIAPLATFAGLYAMIFVTLDKDKPMSDAAPIGAGAGDTGNANALGQWLAGRDPDAVSLATKAKRERLMISPRDWPGGVVLVLPQEVYAEPVGILWKVILFSNDGVGDGMTLESGQIDVVISQEQLRNKVIHLVPDRSEVLLSWTRVPNDQFQVKNNRDTEDSIIVSLEPQIPPFEIGVNDPLPVRVPISLFERYKSP